LVSLNRIQFRSNVFGENAAKATLERLLVTAEGFNLPLHSLILLDAWLPNPQAVRQALASFGTLRSLDVDLNMFPNHALLTALASGVPPSVRRLSLSGLAGNLSAANINRFSLRLPDLEALHLTC
jgi:hypothetical protein